MKITSLEVRIRMPQKAPPTILPTISARIPLKIPPDFFFRETEFLWNNS